MDPSENLPKPGLGRGGRGAALVQLLKNQKAGSSLQQPKLSIGRGLGVTTYTANPNVPGVSGSIASKSLSNKTSGRGGEILQLLKEGGRGVQMARGRGVFTSKTSEVSGPEAVLAIHDRDRASGTNPTTAHNGVGKHMNGFSNGVGTSESNSSSSSDHGLTDSVVNGVADSLKKVKVADRELVEYHGSHGTPVDICVNTVKLKCQNEAIYQYFVSFSPELDSKNMRFIMLNQHKDVIGDTKTFDGQMLYLPKRLPQDETKLKSIRRTDDVQIHVMIRLTQAIHPASQLLIPFYNSVLHRCMHKMEMCAVGRNYYDPHSPKRIDKLRLSLWPGYVTSIKNFEGGLLLNIDVSHKVLRNDTARNIMQDIYQQSPSSFKETCTKELVGAVVLTRYNNKNYRIDDIAWNISPSSTFTTSRGETITFKDYYKIQYKIEIQDMLQPMLISRPKRSTQRAQREKEGKDVEICLVPELCFLTGLSDKIRNDFRAMKEIKEHTCMHPMDRNVAIEKFLHRVETTPEAREELLKWGLQLDRSTTMTSARQFLPEKVTVGNGQQFVCNSNADFSREICRAPVIRPVNINNWLIFFIRRDAKKARQFVDKLQEVSSKLGMRVNQPHFVELRDDRGSSYKNAISSAITPQVQLVVCIFPTSRDDRYSALKKVCCVDMPVPSQVILSRTLPEDVKASKFRSVTVKIALQLNCKLGGELWALSIPLKDLMVVGIDVYHDASGKGNSVAAFVASINNLLTRWYSKAILQKAHQEVIDGLKLCFTESIKKFYEINHCLPARIIIYRDGVGDGQLKHVAEHEMPQMQSCFEMFNNIHGGVYKPKLSVVIVSKRINIRFFGAGHRTLDNPAPGTVLDHTATRPNWPDFFLVSQHVRQGTVSPTHYIVVYGENELKPDHMQQLSYKLTHMYYNWPGTVRVPAPCQYAHKLAYLVGQNLRSEPSLKLCDRLFYL